MTDESLFKYLQLQELSEQEAKTVKGGINVDVSYLKLGGCPACLSGIPTLDPLSYIISPSSLATNQIL